MTFYAHHHMAPSQLVAGGWRIVLSFQGLCNMFPPDVCFIEDFSGLYMIRRTKEVGCFFSLRSGSNRLIVNLADSDHELHDTVIHIHRAWEITRQKDRGIVQTVWSKGTLAHKEAPVTTKVEERVWRLLQIEVNYGNWSWLLNPSQPLIPRTILGTQEEAGSTFMADMITGRKALG